MENTISIPGYSDLKHLGEGAFGMVYRGTDNASGEERALKVLRLAKSAWKEIDVLSSLPQHPHIIGYELSIALAGGSYCLVMEYCSGGNLNDYRLTHRRKPVRDLRFMREIASAVAFLHRNDVIHYDLKQDNILLTASETLKVADLGISKLASESQQGGSLYSCYTSTAYGHIFFCAPELFKRKSTKKADIFQMGVIFASLLQECQVMQTGQSKIVGVFVDGKGLGQALHDGGLQRYKLHGGLGISQGLRTLVECMLDKDHHARPKAVTVEQSLKDIREWPSPYGQEQEGSSYYGSGIRLTPNANNRGVTLADALLGLGVALGVGVIYI